MLKSASIRLALACVCCWYSFLSNANTLNFTISQSLTMPLASISLANNGLTVNRDKGLMIELGNKISDALTMTPNFLAVPRDELIDQLLNGHTDMVCYLVPSWIQSAADSVDWSAPFMESREIIISKNQIARIVQPEDLKGKNLGVIQHYHYPLLAELVNKKSINLTYSNTETNNFMALFRRNNVDAIIIQDLTFDWLAKKHRNLVHKTKVQKHPLVITSSKPQCAISRHANLDLTLVNKGIAAFKKAMGYDF